jgi:2-keto-3-deoxy-L-rhamnonate aldolase RhmA
MNHKDSDSKPLIGTLFSVGNTQIAEIISLAGFDWVLIDMEHSVMSLEDVLQSARALGERILKIVRVPGNDDIWIKRVLDTGCDGILVPMIKTAEEVHRAVVSSKYPVEGQRSIGITRAQGYGFTFQQYAERANDELLIMIQIEHIDGIRNIDSILKTEGIGAIFIGPYDLSASMGLMGQPGHPEVRKAIDLVKHKCREANIEYGIFGGSPETLKGEIEGGCKYLLCGIDVAVISDMYGRLASKLIALK